MSTVYLPFQNLLKKFNVPIIQESGLRQTGYYYNVFMNSKYIILDESTRLSHYLHELAHFIDHELHVEFNPGLNFNDHKYVFSSNYGKQGRYIRTNDEIVANKVSKLLCAKLGIKLNYEDKNRTKRKAPKRLIKRVNAIMRFIENNSEE